MSDPDLSQLPTKGSEKAETQKDQTTLTDPQSSPASAGFPGRIGRYRILQRLGRGGMGEVFEAEQTEPVHRKVALKLIKGGMDTQEVLARFDSERQALALMNHPNVARMLDGGATEQGRPYFVMEYIQGVPITEYCDAHELSTSERLELFVQVCDGVQHAHQKGIVHRDIKPSNVLVTVEDQKAIPKIIDFGLAKALGSGEPDMTQFTHIGQIIGTPSYMSPEQVSGSDIDTRTDVYSLGVLLYQLLAGSVPFELKITPHEGWDAFKKKVSEQEPVRPSSRTSSLGDSSADTASKRRIDPASWSKELRGDLDWITLRALEKDRTHRYQSPSELAADITRHLKHEPVLAGPPSTVYRVRKFIRRHRIGAAAAAVVALALVAGITGTTIGLIRATRAEKAAVEESENTRQLSDFLLGLFRVSDPSEARGNTITAREILDKGAQKIERELGGRPAIKAEMMRTIGGVYDSLGLYKQAQPLLERSLVIARTAAERKPLLLSNSLLQLAGLYIAQGKYTQALALAQEGLSIQEKALGPEHREVSRGLLLVGIIYRNMGKYAEAKSQIERALSIREKALGPEHVEVLDTLYHLGWLHKLMGKYDESANFYGRVLAIKEKKLGMDHPDVASALNDIGVVREEKGDYPGALKLFSQALGIREKVYSPDHPEIAASLDNIGGVLWYMGKYTEARPYYERAIKIRERALGPAHPDLAKSLNNLALLFRYLGEEVKSRPLYERSLAIDEKALGPEHPDVAHDLTNLALLLASRGELVEAERLCTRALTIEEKVLGPDHAEVAFTLRSLGQLNRRSGKYEKARSFFEGALSIQEKKLGLQHAQVATTLTELGRLHVDCGNYKKARNLYERALLIREKAYGTEDPRVVFSLENLVSLDSSNGKQQAARPIIERATAICEKSLAIQEKAGGSKDPKVANTLQNLAWLQGQKASYEKARSYYERALAIQESVESLLGLGRLHFANSRYREARRLYERALAIQEKKWGSQSWAVAEILADLARLDISQGGFAEADSYFKQVTAIVQKVQGETPIFSYNQACYCALLKDRDQAIYYLKQAVARGFDSKYKIAHDSDLAFIRGDPEFKAILKSLPALEASP
jgi:eukaryotic-like serine/threonine-protein kinase